MGWHAAASGGGAGQGNPPLLGRRKDSAHPARKERGRATWAAAEAAPTSMSSLSKSTRTTLGSGSRRARARCGHVRQELHHPARPGFSLEETGTLSAPAPSPAVPPAPPQPGRRSAHLALRSAPRHVLAPGQAQRPAQLRAAAPARGRLRRLGALAVFSVSRHGPRQA